MSSLLWSAPFESLRRKRRCAYLRKSLLAHRVNNLIKTVKYLFWEPLKTGSGKGSRQWAPVTASHKERAVQKLTQPVEKREEEFHPIIRSKIVSTPWMIYYSRSLKA